MVEERVLQQWPPDVYLSPRPAVFGGFFGPYREKAYFNTPSNGDCLTNSAVRRRGNETIMTTAKKISKGIRTVEPLCPPSGVSLPLQLWGLAEQSRIDQMDLQKVDRKVSSLEIYTLPLSRYDESQ